MIRDPFYRVIVERLGGELDPDAFERCAADVLRDDFPTLVPIRGGNDAGMDGAIADGAGEPYPLVSTTSPKVIGNFTRSLDSYASRGGVRRRAVLATSQALSARKWRNLNKRAEEKGFELVHVYDRAAFADRLYRNSGWCKELLGLTGAPSALSVVPLTRRPLVNVSVVGRDGELSWLRESDGDRLLVGPSGSGKTFLLHALALEGWGLFLVGEDPVEIAAALRDQQPGVVIVDDAHLYPERLVELRRHREVTKADFSIVATAWKGEEDPVVDAMCIHRGKVCELELLVRDEIVRVVEESGVREPLWLVREIVDQAEGRPGLAVTLARLCLQGGTREVALGEHLLRHTVTAFEGLVGPEMTQVLAAFALGGNAGMLRSLVSRELGMPTYKLDSAVTRLAVGGVVDVARSSLRRFAGNEPDGDNLSVRPPNLRYALVRDVFFGSVPSPSYTTALLEAAPDLTEAARTLVRSAWYGADVPPNVLLSSLERAGASAPWDEYVALGAAEARWVLDNRPELIESVARPALVRAPEDAVPRLLDSAVGDKRPLNSHPEHPSRVLEDWVKGAVPGTGEALPRRRLLVEAVAAWISAGGDDEVASRVVRSAMSPEFGDAFSDPGSGTRFTMRFGLLLPDELAELQGLWGRVLQVVGSLRNVAWKHLLEMIRDWAYPNSQIKGVEQYVNRMRRFAGRMLADVARISNGHPGVSHQVHEMARVLNQGLSVPLDKEFETLFPADRFEDYRSARERRVAAVRELAVRWSSRDSDLVSRRVRELENAAADVGLNYPRYTPLLCEEIAELCSRPGDWVRALLDEQAVGDLVAPFLQKVARANEDQWEDVVPSLLKDPSLKHVAVVLILTLSDPPPRLLSASLAESDGLHNLVRWNAAMGRIPKDTLALLLAHESTKISTAAALGRVASRSRRQRAGRPLP